MNDWPIEERVGGVRLSGVASSREFVWNAEEKRCDEDGGHCVTDEARQKSRLIHLIADMRQMPA